MPQFLPFDERRANELTEKLARTMFRSPSDFVEFYNSGLISKRHTDVATMAKLITETYKDVKEQGGNLVFISHEEIQLEELASAISQWTVVSKVKREVNRLVSEGVLEDNNSLIFFHADTPGYLLVAADDGDGYEKASSERLFSRHEDIVEVHDLISSNENQVSDEVRFRVHELQNHDLSFIGRMHELLP